MGWFILFGIIGAAALIAGIVAIKIIRINKRHRGHRDTMYPLW